MAWWYQLHWTELIHIHISTGVPGGQLFCIDFEMSWKVQQKHLNPILRLIDAKYQRKRAQVRSWELLDYSLQWACAAFNQATSSTVFQQAGQEALPANVHADSRVFKS